MAEKSEIFRRVVQKLSKVTAPQKRALSITENTEIYRDLGIYGDDMVDLVWWLNKEFGVKSNINPFRYTPPESPFFRVILAARRMMGIEPHYESLKVGDIIAAINAKSWPSEDLGPDVPHVE